MKISADQIDKKAIAGKTKDGNPVVYIATKGGLHAFFTKDESGSICSIGAAPHKAIAKFLASKKHEIEWKEDFSKSEEEMAKSELALFERLRNAVFAQQAPGTEKTDVYMIYDISKKEIQVMKKSELEEELKAGTVSKYALVRDTSLTRRAVFAKDCEALEHMFGEE